MEAKEKKTKKFKWWYVLIAIVVIGGIAGIGGNKDDATDNTNSTTTVEETEVTSDFILDIGALTDNDIGELDTADLSLHTGDLLYVNYCGNGLVIVKAKIQSLFSNEQTINQNYYNVGQLIKDNGFDSCEELQYWAVADTTNGDEVKVISFTVDKATIDKIENGSIVDNQLGDYVSDLYILPSLQG